MPRQMQCDQENASQKIPPTNRNAGVFCTTTAGAISHLRSERPSPPAEVIDHRRSKTTANSTLLTTDVCVLVFTLHGVVVTACFLERLLQKFDVLRIVGILDHLGEGQPWVATVLLARNADMCSTVLPVIVATVEDFGAAFDSALMFFDAKVDSLVALEMLRPLEPAVAPVPVAVLPLDSRTTDWFPLPGDRVELVTFNVDVAIV